MSRRRKSLKLLFVADPLAQFHPQRETSLVIMHEAQRRGHRVFATTPERLSSRGRAVEAAVQELKILGIGKTPWHRVLAEQRLELKSFDAVLLRKDPPFDQNYLHHLYLLELLAGEVYMMNHPRGILEANEKLFPLRFPELTPATVVSAEFEVLRDFILAQPQGAVLKPINSSGGRGIFVIPKGRKENFKVILETCTENFTRHVVAQRFLPEIAKGDKRVMLLGGEILGSFIRLPARGEHRANLHSGGSAHPAPVTASDRRIVQALQGSLQDLGLDFVGLDVIGPCLTEVNVTSPMGLAEINLTSGGHSQIQVVDFIENKLNHPTAAPAPTPRPNRPVKALPKVPQIG
ncbi:MAG: glutathione synthase [bacterium]